MLDTRIQPFAVILRLDRSIQPLIKYITHHNAIFPAGTKADDSPFVLIGVFGIGEVFAIEGDVDVCHAIPHFGI